jgi:hypothetical protein
LQEEFGDSWETARVDKFSANIFIAFFGEYLVGKFSEIALWLRISRVSQPKKNPAILQGEFGDSWETARVDKFSAKIAFFPKNQNFVIK